MRTPGLLRSSIANFPPNYKDPNSPRLALSSFFFLSSLNHTLSDFSVANLTSVTHTLFNPTTNALSATHPPLQTLLNFLDGIF